MLFLKKIFLLLEINLDILLIIFEWLTNKYFDCFKLISNMANKKLLTASNKFRHTSHYF